MRYIGSSIHSICHCSSSLPVCLQNIKDIPSLKDYTRKNAKRLLLPYVGTFLMLCVGENCSHLRVYTSQDANTKGRL